MEDISNSCRSVKIFKNKEKLELTEISSILMDAAKNLEQCSFEQQLLCPKAGEAYL